MAIFPSLAPIRGNSAATSRVRSLTCLSGRTGLSFSSVCSPGKGWVRFCAWSESAPSQIAAAIQRMKSDGLVNLPCRITILSSGRRENAGGFVLGYPFHLVLFDRPLTVFPHNLVVVARATQIPFIVATADLDFVLIYPSDFLNVKNQSIPNSSIPLFCQRNSLNGWFMPLETLHKIT